MSNKSDGKRGNINRFFRKLRKSTHESCPETITRNVFERIGIADSNRSMEPVAPVTFPSRWMAAAVASAAVVLIIVTLQLSIPKPAPLTGRTLSDAQIEKADAEFKATMRLVYRFSQRSKEVICQDIMTDAVGKPVDDSVRYVVNSLKGV